MRTVPSHTSHMLKPILLSFGTSSATLDGGFCWLCSVERDPDIVRQKVG